MRPSEPNIRSCRRGCALAIARLDNCVGAGQALTMLNVDARLLTLVDVAEVLNTSRSQAHSCAESI
jgi:hypothetical protein